MKRTKNFGITIPKKLSKGGNLVLKDEGFPKHNGENQQFNEKITRANLKRNLRKKTHENDKTSANISATKIGT